MMQIRLMHPCPESGGRRSEVRPPLSALRSPLSDLRHCWPFGDPLVNYLENPFALCANQRQTRRAHPLAAQAALLHCQLNVLDELGVYIQMQQRRKPPINFAGLVPLTAAGELPEVLVLSGESDAAARHPAGKGQNGDLQHEILHPRDDCVTATPPD